MSLKAKIDADATKLLQTIQRRLMTGVPEHVSKRAIAKAMTDIARAAIREAVLVSNSEYEIYSKPGANGVPERYIEMCTAMVLGEEAGDHE